MIQNKAVGLEFLSYFRKFSGIYKMNKLHIKYSWYLSFTCFLKQGVWMPDFFRLPAFLEENEMVRGLLRDNCQKASWVG